MAKKVYYGEKATKELLRLIETATAKSGLVFVEDEHEKRLEADVKAFEALLP